MEQKIVCEQYNANDDIYFIEFIEQSGNKVNKGDLLVVIETSKATIDLYSDFDGFFYSNIVNTNEIKVGETIGFVSDKKISESQELEKIESNELSDYDTDTKSSSFEKNEIKIQNIKRIAVIGGGKAFDQIYDLVANLSDYVITALFDDELTKKGYSKKYGVPIIGEISLENILQSYYSGDFDQIIISVGGNLSFRMNWYNKLSGRIPFAKLIHPKTYVSNFSNIGEGTVVFQFSSLSFDAKVGNNCFLSAYSNIEHHCSLGSNVTTGPGVKLSGNVKTGDNVKFGTGIFIEPNVTIGSNCVIGSGVVVTNNVEDNKILVKENNHTQKDNKWVSR